MEGSKLTKICSAELEREDFDAGPLNLDCIEPGLWLGNLTAATDLDTLERHRINFILTVDSCPLPQNISTLSGIQSFFVQVTDMPQEDLMCHFEETFQFIKTGQEQGCVLVHCYFGVSRSVSVVIAYIMKKYQLSYKDALQRVKSCRRLVGPNRGFEDQLRLYGRMGCTIDSNNIQFRMFCLRMAAEKVKKVKILPRECMAVVKPDPSLTCVNPNPLVYRCCKCRRIVASAANLLPHMPREKPSWKDEKWIDKMSENPTCTLTYFVEPMTWMKSALQSEQGKLYCPKCTSKLGSFSWIMERNPLNDGLHIYTNEPLMKNKAKAGARIYSSLFSQYISVGEDKSSFDSEIQIIEKTWEELRGKPRMTMFRLNTGRDA